MQLISSSYNIIKPIYMHPITVRELHKHKIQKNKKKTHLLCRAANVYSVGPKTKVQVYLLVSSHVWSGSNHHKTRTLKSPCEEISCLITMITYVHRSQTICQALSYAVYIYCFIPSSQQPWGDVLMLCPFSP